MPEFPGRLRPPRIASAPATPANGELYYDTAANVLYWYNGSAWVPTGNRPGYATTLPASPYDGQEAILVNSTTSPSWQWVFRWNAGSSNTDKWELVGGAPALVTVATDETTTTVGSAVDLATVGPQFTIPRAGVYLVAVTADMYHTAANSVMQIVNTVAAANVVVPLAMSATTGNGFAGGTYAASAVVKMQYYNGTAGTAHYRNRALQVTPVRVS